VILDYIAAEGLASGAAVARKLGISRQAVNKHMKSLVAAGKIVREGSTRNTIYRFPSDDREEGAAGYHKRFSSENLEEDQVFEEISIRMNLQSELNDRCYDIVRYAFTEVMNNAVDHSGSRQIEAAVNLYAYDLQFTVRDFGVGIFRHIADSYHLQDEYNAIGWLMKGKQTTMPERHAGEGLFFTTKIGDIVTIRSHRLVLELLNDKDDLYTGKKSWIKGTEVSFTIKRRTRKRLKALFDEYAPEEYDYQFSRTRVQVKLSQKSYMSRSEGRRLVSGLDAFHEVVFDFRGVLSIGQAFSDEVFRVFPERYPDVKVSVEHADPVIVQMLKHVGADNYASGVVDNIG
jgi:anti-sigma regulatory factor (Ser/Thr protein kinase)